MGNGLGVVLNCNAQVQELLGYDRSSLIGKNVTKLMPKIYSELHNNFMLDFIRTPSRLALKTVPALTRSALLQQLHLTVRLMSSPDNALVIVGFMRRAEESDAGLLMVSVSSGDVLGADGQFLRLVGGRLTAKQIAQEEVRLAGLMPEMDLQRLEEEGSQLTVLEVGNIVAVEGADIDATKRVRV